MKVKCKVCRKDIEVNEAEYNPGEKIIVECDRCGSQIEVAIPEREEKLTKKEPRIVETSVTEEGNVSKSDVEIKKTDSNQNDDSTVITSNEVVQPVASSAIPPEVAAVSPIGYSEPEKAGKRWIIVIVLLLLVGGAGGWWYYDNIYMPEKIDREAARTYPIVNLNLRSSKMSGSDYNKLSSVPYGGELITYNIDGEWADVKYVKPDGSEATKGYAAAPYLLNKKDFYLLNSIFGDNDAREILATAKVRKALLEYYKYKGYVGKISPELMNEVGLSASSDSQWQVFFPHGDKKPNEVVFKRLMNPNSKFTDMAVIIQNIQTGDRKLVYFYFDDDETPRLLGEMDAPPVGVLKDVINNNGDITPIFGD